MKRGDLYRVRRPGRSDPRKTRVFALVSLPKLALTDFVGALVTTPMLRPARAAHDLGGILSIFRRPLQGHS